MVDAIEREVIATANEVKKANKPKALADMTRREWFYTYCDFDDISVVNRMFQWYLTKRTKDGDPLWKKEEIYEEWMNGIFDYSEYAEAKKPRSDRGSVPKSFWNSWGYKACFR